LLVDVKKLFSAAMIRQRLLNGMRRKYVWAHFAI